MGAFGLSGYASLGSETWGIPALVEFSVFLSAAVGIGVPLILKN